MLKISQKEAFYLRESGRGNDVHMANRTHQKAKHYFATESPKTLKLLEKYRLSIISEGGE